MVSVWLHRSYLLRGVEFHWHVSDSVHVNTWWSMKYCSMIRISLNSAYEKPRFCTTNKWLSLEHEYSTACGSNLRAVRTCCEPLMIYIPDFILLKIHRNSTICEPYITRYCESCLKTRKKEVEHLEGSKKVPKDSHGAQDRKKRDQDNDWIYNPLLNWQ